MRGGAHLGHEGPFHPIGSVATRDEPSHMRAGGRLVEEALYLSLHLFIGPARESWVVVEARARSPAGSSGTFSCPCGGFESSMHFRRLVVGSATSSRRPCHGCLGDRLGDSRRGDVLDDRGER